VTGRNPSQGDRLEEAHRELGDQLLGYGLGLVGGAGGLMWATGQVAGLLFGQDWIQVGANELVHVLTQLPQHLGDPTQAWPAAAQAELPGPVGMYASLGLTTGSTVAVLAGLLRLKEHVSPGRGRPGHLRGHRQEGARWASRWDLRGLLIREPRAGRVVLGRLGRLGHRGPLLAAEDCQSVLIFGPPGSLKTAGEVIPAVLEWDGPLVTTSVKTDVLDATAADRAQVGQVTVLDPLGLSGWPSARWSPLAACATWPGAIKTAEVMASTSEGGAGGGEQRDARFWDDLAAKLLGPALLAAAVTSGSMREVVRWIDTRDPDEEVAKILGDLAEDLAGDGPLLAWQASRQHSDRTQDSVYVSAERLLQVYADPRVAAMTDGHELDFEEFLTSANSLYLYAPVHEQQRLRPVFELVIAQLLEVAQTTAARSPGGMLSPRLLLALDEAANVAALANLPELATTGRGQGIQVLSVWHDLAQISHRYGRRAATVLNGHRAKVFLPGLADVDVLELGAKLIGERAYSETTTSWDTFGAPSTSQTATSFRPLVPVDELRQLRTGQGVVVYGNRRPACIRLRPWFTRAEQRRRARAEQRGHRQHQPSLLRRLGWARPAVRAFGADGRGGDRL
jgi:type IV secretion system protein VirD4